MVGPQIGETRDHTEKALSLKQLDGRLRLAATLTGGRELWITSAAESQDLGFEELDAEVFHNDDDTRPVASGLRATGC